MIPVTKTFFPDLDDYIVQLEKVWQSGWMTNNAGLSHELTDQLKVFLQVSELELVANGTLALQLAIKALDLQGEIITTPYSYVATTTAIIWEGCDPVFVDIDEDSFCIDPQLIEAAITEKTCAILATHVYGYPCDVGQIQHIADKYKLKVIYDAAHCFGVRLNGQSILSHGDCSAISFHATKLFHTAEGGAVVSRDNNVSQRIGIMKKFGHEGEDEYMDIGINAKISELHAAIGLCVLPVISEMINKRCALTEYYNKLLDNSVLKCPVVPGGVDYNYSYYPVVFPSHDVMMSTRKALMDNDILPRRYFYPSLNTLPYLKPELKIECAVSEDVAGRVLCLPLYDKLVSTDIDNICSLLLNDLK